MKLSSSISWSLLRQLHHLGAAFVILALLPACASQDSPLARSDIGRYINRTWDDLTRSPVDCDALVDPKVPAGQSVLYLPGDEPVTDALRRTAQSCGITLASLPQEQRVGTPLPLPQNPGLLYLPHAYVVPGGRFNEMYGWDSYFIVEGLVANKRAPLARDMTENFFYELDHYGAILNANRTYYLTRSQPPFLTSMVLAVAGTLDGPERRAFLTRGYAAAQKDWAFWNRPEFRAGSAGLTRYFDFGTGPVPELHDDPAYYQNVLSKLLALGPEGRPFLRELPEGASTAPLATQNGRRYTLTDDFYLGDRAMRASGFDTSFRFGPYGGATHHFAPVCLNALLYKEETDLAAIAEELKLPDDAAQWRSRADARSAAIMRYLWDDAAAMFFDYDFIAGKRSDYFYATAFYPLWAGLPSADQAQRLAGHLPEFLHQGGLAMSVRVTGAQWDLPFGWAPIQFLAVEGLRRYGIGAQADAISERWLRMVVDNFYREGTLREKYDVITRSSDVQVQVGYTTNVAGFGWTNAAVVRLLPQLPQAVQEQILTPPPAATARPPFRRSL